MSRPNTFRRENKTITYLTPNIREYVLAYSEKHNVSVSTAVCELLQLLCDIKDTTRKIK